MNELLSFWEDQHSKNNIFWLTGSSAHSVMEMHKIKPVHNINFMDIGVGMGQMSEYQYGLRNNIYAVDVSAIALQKIKSITKQTYFTEQLSALSEEFIDLAICHLVFQHCNDMEVNFIIQNVFKILKPNGLFSFQIAECKSYEDLDPFHQSGVQNKTHYFRTKIEIMLLLKNLNIENVEFVNEIFYPDQGNITWHFVHIKKI